MFVRLIPDRSSIFNELHPSKILSKSEIDEKSKYDKLSDCKEVQL